jgi:cyclophilin family peptidyl-prolyl cis-trans isomerase
MEAVNCGTLEHVTKFLAGMVVLLVAVVGLVLFLARNNPRKAETNQQDMLNSISNSIDIASPAAGNSPVATPGAAVRSWTTPPPLSLDQNKTYTATVNTSKGSMTFELFAKEAPLTVNNFVFLAKNNFYNGTIFHRIIRDFMIQGGDPQGTGVGGPGYQFADETITRDYIRGTLAMANAGPNTNGSQFFIMTKEVPLLKSYTIFGLLTAGDEVLQKIAETPVTTSQAGENSKPTEEVTVNSVTISE